MPLFYQKTVTYLPSLSVTYLTTLYITRLRRKATCLVAYHKFATCLTTFVGDDACIVPLDGPCSVSLLNPYTGTSAVLPTQNSVLQIFRVQLGKGAAGSGDPALPLLCGLAAQEDTL